MRDSQRQKVYNWENSKPWMSKKGDELTYQQAEHIVHKLNPKMYIVKGRAGCTAYCHSRYISLPTWALTWGVVLHELAHSFTPDQHGPKFVGCYVYLLHKFHPMHPSISELTASLNEANVQFTGIYNWGKKFNRIKLNVESLQTVKLSWERSTEITFKTYPKRASSVKKKLGQLITVSINIDMYLNSKYGQVEPLMKAYNKRYDDKLSVSDVKYFIKTGLLVSRQIDNAYSRQLQHKRAKVR
jgi:hypothetical protein